MAQRKKLRARQAADQLWLLGWAVVVLAVVSAVIEWRASGLSHIYMAPGFALAALIFLALSRVLDWLVKRLLERTEGVWDDLYEVKAPAPPPSWPSADRSPWEK
ncbi:MAG: hypothetical protein QM608_03990 [Caulobacter sp.]